MFSAGYEACQEKTSDACVVPLKQNPRRVGASFLPRVKSIVLIIIIIIIIIIITTAVFSGALNC